MLLYTVKRHICAGMVQQYLTSNLHSSLKLWSHFFSGPFSPDCGIVLSRFALDTIRCKVGKTQLFRGLMSKLVAPVDLLNHP